jgi:hypothetical protein
MSKLLVLFVFHIYNERVKSFINKAIFYDKDIDFIVISNNKNIILKVPNYVKILNRDNIGYDFGGWSDALLINNLYKEYDNFIFVNSSVIGPYLPSSYKGKWTDIFLDGLKNDIKLFGSTINTCDQPLTHSHVQSYIFSMDKNTLQYLIDCHIFSMTNYAKTFNDAIWQKEVLMSRKIIENNWNIGSLMLYYKDIDFRFRDKKPEDYNIKFINDIMYSSFIDLLWTKEELVFVKGNRLNIENNILKSWTFIGNENDTVSVPIETLVRYGANNKYNFQIKSNSFIADNKTFGDPIPNIKKKIYAYI